MTGRPDMQTLSARFETFQVPHQLAKRRASAQAGRKKGGNTVEWPHKLPESKDLARAGFYFDPAPESSDNVQCFFCDVNLDGWEESDVPIREHLAHRSSCEYAKCLCAALDAITKVDEGSLTDLEAFDPMTDELVAARRATFERGSKWPHESKKGWKCKIAKLVNAGWCFDPAPTAVEDEESDDVTCFYCELSLGGWERQDDPLAEHRRRSPNCPFFFILDKSASSKPKKAGGKAARGSTTSKTSRISTQSALSTFSEQASLADSQTLEDLAEPDDSIVTAGTTASQATVTDKTAGQKKRKGKAASKTTKTRSRAGTVDSQTRPESLYPDLSQSQDLSQQNSMTQPGVDEELGGPAKRPRKGTRVSKQAGASEVDVPPTTEVPAQKPTRGRKPKAASQVRSEAEPKVEEHEELDQSIASAQLLDELDRSLSIDLDAKFELDERAVQPASDIGQATRGIKRTSDGLQKSQKDVPADRDSSVMLVDFPVPPATKAPPKTQKGRKASKQIQSSAADTAQIDKRNVSQPGDFEGDSQAAPPDREAMEVEKAPPKAKGGKGRKASSNKSTKSSNASTTTAPALSFMQQGQEDLEQDEREIEAELARIAADQAQNTDQQAMQIETDKVDEFEASPSSVVKKSQQSVEMDYHVDAIHHLERELQAEVDQLPQPGNANLATYVKAVARSSSSTKSHPATDGAPDQTPSPSGSDKENAPSSTPFNSNALGKKRATGGSPATERSINNTSENQTGAVRIPLASTTPNRAPAAAFKSPNKLLSHPTSTIPWEPKDLETLLLASPPHPLATVEFSSLSPNGGGGGATAGGSFAARLAGAAGVLPSPEKKLTVEEWVRLQAEKGDSELRRRCEELVARFEREGNRAMTSLGGLVVSDAGIAR